VDGTVWDKKDSEVRMRKALIYRKGNIMDELKSCPFCGKDSPKISCKPYRKIKSRGQSYLATVKCSNWGCTAQVSQAAFDIETAKLYATNNWNKRE
jgi:hypothetical protein